MTRADLAALLRESQMRNINRQITGLLLRVDNSFVQYFEGPESGVLQLWSSILGDPRHQDVQCIYREPIPQRMFEHWSMAFSELTTPSLRPSPSNELLMCMLQDPPPADERGTPDDAFHRFWADCASTLPR
jgi:Sensors of blue-light using FAD